ncbi:protein TOO MANY MOUTHS-like [Nicotiana tabacum]|uniref:Protein TOO MANY MOUTHS-like n=1 Tax=Nicotiana tabacum TaxID=4097 RepID=A0A1S4DKC6_TOBAC|nr:PREDICTED: protein TOO MANY MOUTHS-like [Nicotiana tabacum]
MAFFLSIQATLLLFLSFFPLGWSFTVIMSDSGTPSALVDAPQTGYSMNNNRARTDPREREAVYDIMRATGNDWATDIPDVCRDRWHGIECMPDYDNVYHVVSLSFGALSDDTAFPTCDSTHSFISPSVTKLPHLRTLFFYRCFSNNPQPIPAFLAQLGPTLQTLVLRENGFTGPIPNELGNLTSLRVLDLHKNNLNGSIPVSLGRITGLRSLDLSDNKLTGSIPSLTFPQLNVLDLNQNHLAGSIPSTLMKCHWLIKLDLSRNRLSGSIPYSIDNLNNLILMDLSYNSLTGSFPISLKKLNFLQALILNGNPMDSATLPVNGFDGFKDLMILALSNMNLQGSIPNSLGRLPKIRVLHLDGNQFNGSIPLSFGNLNSLSELRLNNNMLSGPIPFKRDMVWRMRRKMKLANNEGLCYNNENGLGDDLETLLDSGIGHCGDSKTEPTKIVEHISTLNRGSISRSNSDSGVTLNKLQLLSKSLIQSATLVLFAFHLL